MTKATHLVLVALLVSFLFPLTGMAGQSQNPAPAPAPEVGPGGDSGQSDQAGQADQIGQSKGCGLWAFIKKNLKKLFEKNPEQDAELLKKLLVLAAKDLELALQAIDGKDKCYAKAFPAVGHLNHALSALHKGRPPKHLKPAFKQLEKRISHAKFYLVVYDFEEAAARIEAAKDYIGELN
ncbi:MAG: hypothetical protein OZSIB_1657 [Candidatus Ozemobacter sibiricus]|jgi:hypothetical protein|uniref:Uncharacterized protein n=1 Tax=Candidatus Ozemobacter sibiricus TaxID=2268124 RepID=A0A367ZJS0_9BACT|nr:MAG: hypothetical protein OZSIB_1657 [Candidatus Ozemobacter sibiricus]